MHVQNGALFKLIPFREVFVISSPLPSTWSAYLGLVSEQSNLVSESTVLLSESAVLVSESALLVAESVFLVSES